MSFYKFAKEDIINTKILTYPSYTIELYGNKLTGSVYLEKPFLNPSMSGRTYQGFSEREGGFVQKLGPFSSSIEMLTVVSGGTDKEIYESVNNLYGYYSAINTDYARTFTGSISTTFRIVNLPEIFYDREVLTGSFTASDIDAAGASRILYDNGRGGLYSGSLSGTLVGHIFYSEGLAVLTKPDLSDFGNVSSTNFKFRIQFKGTHSIPTKIFRCRAGIGQLNASSNPTFYQIPLSSSDTNRNEREIVMNPLAVYVTHIGLYNDDYELVAIATLAQPVKKEESQDIMFRLRMDF